MGDEVALVVALVGFFRVGGVNDMVCTLFSSLFSYLLK